jgi:prolyl oligopeptidase
MNPGLGVKDKFQWLEATSNPKVISWARKQDREARRSVKVQSDILLGRLVSFYHMPIMRSVQLTKAGVVLFLSDDKSYSVELLKPNGEREEIADSRGLGKDVVIQSVQAKSDGRTLAVHYSKGGSDEGTVTMMDTISREAIDTIEGFLGQILWTKDGYYYVRTYRNQKTPDGVGPPASRVILRHGEREEVVFGTGLPTNTFIEIAESQDGSDALVDAFSWTKSRPYGGKLSSPESWSPVYPDVDSIVLNVGTLEGKHLLLSYEKGLGEVLSVGRGRPRRVVGEGRWPLQSVVPVGATLLCHYLVNACSKLVLYDTGGRPSGAIKFPTLGSLVEPPDRSAISTLDGEAVFAFTSFTIPYIIYRIRDGRVENLLSSEVREDYSVKHQRAVSADGTRIHYFETTKRGASPKKSLLFGYGGFRISPVPTFNPAYMPLLEDGVSYVVANLRGGLEHGEEWHRNGMRDKKHHVFEDYIAVLAKLKHEGKNVVGFGRSNGGLLMGATMNARPDLFDGVLIGYPVLDMLRYHRLLLGKAWVPEYGDPDVPKDRKFLMKYSPYHNVRPGTRYPPVLIYSGLKDDRVHPGHAFKFYAKLKEAGVDASLRVEMNSGHIGTTPQIRILEEADKLAFVYRCLGLAPVRAE